MSQSLMSVNAKVTHSTNVHMIKSFSVKYTRIYSAAQLLEGNMYSQLAGGNTPRHVNEDLCPTFGTGA